MVKKIHGFDYLRAISSTLVVAWHVDLLEPLKKGDTLLVNLVNIFYYNIALIAVPIFFQVSLFLFYQNRNREGYFRKKRLPSLIKLYSFWTFLSIIFNFLIDRSLPQISNWQSLLTFVISGNNTFWFFFSLIFVTCLAELTSSICQKTQSKGIFTIFIISCVSVFLLPLINLFLGKDCIFFTAWWFPFNFTPYIFSSYILSKVFSSNNYILEINKNTKILWLILFISIVFIFLEWTYLDIPEQWYYTIIPQYSRLSLVLSSLLITWLSLYIQKVPKLIELISEYSLGIFCLHFFIIHLFNKIEIRNWHIPGENIIIFLLTILISMILTKFIRKINLAKGII